MKVLWFTNVPVSLDQKGSGTWLGAMAECLAATGRVELGVIAPGMSNSAGWQDCGWMRQKVVHIPAKCGADGLPDAATVGQILTAVSEFSPDVVHVWGTESFWGLLLARRIITLPAVLTVQGIKERIGQLYWGDLSWRERLACTGPKEVVSAIRAGGGIARRFFRWGPIEREILGGIRTVSCHSEWQEAYVRDANPNARVRYVEMPLRPEFLKPDAGTRGIGNHARVFCSAGYPSPGKGLHTAIRAIGLLAKRYPAIQLRLGGLSPVRHYRGDGYTRWLTKQVSRMGLDQNVVWLGRLGAEEMAQELRACSVVLVPSFIESYCLAMAEAMATGSPVVATYTGGSAHLGRDERTCLFFPSGDAVSCAYQLGRVLADVDFAHRLADHARAEASVRHDPQEIGRRQLAVYSEALAHDHVGQVVAHG